jgi:hypothetical protein
MRKLGHIPDILDYCRNQVSGGTFFFAVNLLDRRSDLLVTQIDVLRDAVRRVRARTPFRIDASTCRRSPFIRGPDQTAPNWCWYESSLEVQCI